MFFINFFFYTLSPMKENVFIVIEGKKENSHDTTLVSPSQIPIDKTTQSEDTLSTKLDHMLKKDHQVKLSKNRFLKRKTYSEGYNTGRWCEVEHRRFIEAIFSYGNDWRKVQRHIITRSSAQARSHAQKFFIRLRNKLNFPISIEDLGSSNSLRFEEIFDMLTKYIKNNYNDEEMSHVADMKKNSKNLIDMLCYFHKKIQAERKWKYFDQIMERCEEFSDMEKESQSTDYICQKIPNIKIPKKPIFKIKKTKQKFMTKFSSSYNEYNENENQSIFNSYLYLIENKINECKRLQNLYLNNSQPSEGNVYEKMMSFFNITNKTPNKINSTSTQQQMESNNPMQNFSHNKKQPVNLFNNDFLNLEYQLSKSNNNEYNMNELNPFKIDFTSMSMSMSVNECQNNNLFNCFNFDEDKETEKRNYFFN
jgi:SHAQKYF class myb-like DNA-binding protein